MNFDNASIILDRLITRSVKEFYPESEIVHRIIDYKNGKKNGKEQVFYRTGELNKKRTWVQGKLEGLCETYYKNGLVYIRCRYKNGLLDGSWVVYDMNASIMESVEYRNGEVVE